jgi:hypothetical protein
MLSLTSLVAPRLFIRNLMRHWHYCAIQIIIIEPETFCCRRDLYRCDFHVKGHLNVMCSIADALNIHCKCSEAGSSTVVRREDAELFRSESGDQRAESVPAAAINWLFRYVLTSSSYAWLDSVLCL